MGPSIYKYLSHKSEPGKQAPLPSGLEVSRTHDTEDCMDGHRSTDTQLNWHLKSPLSLTGPSIAQAILNTFFSEIKDYKQIIDGQ